MERDGWEISGRGIQEKKVFLAEEEYVTLFVGSLKFTRMFASPQNLSELAVGFLVTEGVIEYGNIKDVSVVDKGVSVAVTNGSMTEHDFELRSSGCVGMATTPPNPLKTDAKFGSKVILESLHLLNKESKTWRKTGGTHTACLVSAEGKLVASFEDIGRHNALDKCVGWALLNDVELEDKFILFTGRISTGIVYKAVRARIPLIVSNTAALSKAVETAEKLNLTTVGFARGKKITAYTHPERIK